MTLVETPVRKRLEIVANLRRSIVRGDYGPGSRLPTRVQLEKTFNASSATVQRALDSLIKDGVVSPKGNLGTFVSTRPPHLFRYGLVVPHRPDDPEHWSHFWRALRSEAMAGDEKNKEVFFGSDEYPDHPDYARLIDDIEAHRLAGLIFASTPFHLVNTPLITGDNVFRVAIMAKPEIPGIPAIFPDTHDFLNKALDHLKACGRKRIAIVGVEALAGFYQHFESAVALRGQITKDYWIQILSPHLTQGVQNCAHLLMSGPRDERPDGLIIADDNLVPNATAGLLSAGIRAGTDADIVAHANFPWPTQSVVPAYRIGFDARTIVNRCIESIVQQRRNEPPVPLTLIPAVAESERK